MTGNAVAERRKQELLAEATKPVFGGDLLAVRLLETRDGNLYVRLRAGWSKGGVLGQVCNSQGVELHNTGQYIGQQGALEAAREWAEGEYGPTKVV